MSDTIPFEFDNIAAESENINKENDVKLSENDNPGQVKELSGIESNNSPGENGSKKEQVSVEEPEPLKEVKPIEIKSELTKNAITVLERRYLRKDTEGNILENPDEMFRRVAKCVSKIETKYDNNADVQALEDEFYSIMANREFIPNSPTLMNAGTERGQLSACFVLPVEDSMDGIFDSIKNAALIHKTGGGTGFSFSRLRPNMDIVHSTSGVASGPVSFMSVFDSATEAVKQGGTRRGANMGILRVDHPDILEFITCKYENDKINNFNISVGLTEEFMKAVENKSDYNLINPRSKDVVRTLNARKVFDLIITMAWKNGDPGIIFLDRINKDNPTPDAGEIESTNPCGEQPLLPFESCNLGSINLNQVLETDEDGVKVIDYDKLRKTIHTCVHFLDNVIDANNYPLPEIDQMTKSNRKIGLGLMGFADLLIELGIPYNTEEALDLADNIMSFINKEAKSKSMELAKSKGPFPNFRESIFYKAGLPEIRNSTTTTIAPTGTISIIANASSGIEPIFAVSYFRNVMDNDILVEVNPKFEKIAKERGFYSSDLMRKIAEKGTIQDIEEIPEDVRNIFVTAHDIAPEWHVRMQAAFQQHTDNAVSKTVNCPHESTSKDIEEVYMLAYRLGCKGATVFRDGCRETQVLNIGRDKSKDKEESSEPQIIPRKRGRITNGTTEKIITGDGTLYITVNRDEKGLCEVFCNIGKHGSDAAAWSEAVGRLISLCLRSGISLKSLVSQLRGITSRPIWQEGEQILSVPDAIGKALSRYLDKKGDQLPLTFADYPSMPNNGNGEGGDSFIHRITCPDCGSPIEHEGGCVVCRSCGYSKCG